MSYIGIMEKNMEIIIQGYIGFKVLKALGI